MATWKHWLWLANLRGLSLPLKLNLLEHFGDPEAAYYGQRAEYLLVPGMSEAAARALEDKDASGADRILADCARLGLQLLSLHDAAYPDRLRSIPDPPLLLYVQGRLPLFDGEPTLAMVGSRRASPLGLETAERLAGELAAQGGLILSGLALGVDAAAHRGALRASGTTAAVIAGGHDILYPRENRCLYEDIAARGVILSEYPPGTDHMAEHFPQRNRILSGLSVGVIVVEAPRRSGALITANRAIRQGRDLFAVPGPIFEPRCEGSNRLLAEGALPALDAPGVLGRYAEQFPQRIRVRQQNPPRRQEPPQAPSAQQARRVRKAPPKPEPPERALLERALPEKGLPERGLPTLDLAGDHCLTDDQIRLVRLLRGRTVQVDELIAESRIPTRRALSALTVLELDQIVTQDAGKRFSLAVTLK